MQAILKTYIKYITFEENVIYQNNKKIKTWVFKECPSKKNQSQVSQGNSTTPLRNRQLSKSSLQMLIKLFQGIEKWRKLPNYFYKSSITLIIKSDKEGRKEGNYRPISVLSIDAKIMSISCLLLCDKLP